MSSIRMTLSASAALVALTAIVPAVSLAQAPKAPLQLETQADQTQASTAAVSGKKSQTAKASGKSKKTSARQTAADPVPSDQSQTTSGTATPVIASRAVAAPQAHDNVMRGRDTISLVARLPWWRSDQ